MQIIRFGPRDARDIDSFDSVRATCVALGAGSGEAHAYCIYLKPGGCIGEHPAGLDQLFLIVSGRGWVAGPDGRRLAVRAGEGALFRRGELHSKGSRTGMTALMFQLTKLRRLAPTVK